MKYTSDAKDKNIEKICMIIMNHLLIHGFKDGVSSEVSVLSHPQIIYDKIYKYLYVEDYFDYEKIIEIISYDIIDTWNKNKGKRIVFDNNFKHERTIKKSNSLIYYSVLKFRDKIADSSTPNNKAIDYQSFDKYIDELINKLI